MPQNTHTHTHPSSDDSFSWGPAAVSNAMWTGVWVKDILKHVGIKSFEEGGKHVCFVGADKLPNGYYGTSIRREVRRREMLQ